jgi:hypothetical protein
MQQAMKRQNPQLHRIRMAFAASLPARNPFRNSEIAQKLLRPRAGATVRGKGQHVGNPIDAAVAAVQPPHLGVAHDGDADGTAGRGGSGPCEPRAQRPVGDWPAPSVRDDDSEAALRQSPCHLKSEIWESGIFICEREIGESAIYPAIGESI